MSKTDKEWNYNVLKFAKVECDVSIFTNLKLSFLVVVFIMILLRLLLCIFGYLGMGRGGRGGWKGRERGGQVFKSWKTECVEPYVSLGCTDYLARRRYRLECDFQKSRTELWFVTL